MNGLMINYFMASFNVVITKNYGQFCKINCLPKMPKKKKKYIAVTCNMKRNDKISYYYFLFYF